jgi:hypothetical protein
MSGNLILTVGYHVQVTSMFCVSYILFKFLGCLSWKRNLKKKGGFDVFVFGAVTWLRLSFFFMIENSNIER